MATPLFRPGWQGREQDATPAETYRNRRTFLKQLGLGTVALASAPLACAGDARRGDAPAAASPGPRPDGPLDTIPADAPRHGLPAPRNEAFTVAERPTSDRLLASSYNNFYEFKNQGDLKTVWPLTGDYDPFPWTLEISGLVQKPQRLDLDALIRSMEIEERLYRFRCVEAWAMTVPWAGFPLRKLIERANPLSTATHVRFVCVDRPAQLPGQKAATWYPWPYYEGLRMDEAMNELAFVATGLYGEPLPKQNGSPLRLVLPWKYGYKGPKAVVKIEFTDEQPATFWNDLQAQEYGFLSNVNPNIPHPRWSQASEELLGTERRVPTQLFNGYGEWVAGLYPDEPRTPGPPMAR